MTVFFVRNTCNICHVSSHRPLGGNLYFGKKVSSMSKARQSPISHHLFDEITSEITDVFAQADWNQILSQLAPKIELPPIDLSALFPELPESVILLAKGGWYPNHEMTIGAIQDCAEHIAKGEYQEADPKMIEVFEADYQRTKMRILSEVPERSDVLLNAFRAHERGEFTLSVPVFLIQADGICLDTAKVQLYSKHNKKPKIAGVLNDIATGGITDVFLSPLASNIPLTADPTERTGPDFPKGALNRHQVLHGEVTDYGTKANSFKTVSLFSYICDVSSSLKEGKAA
jgi:hypothetical protein